jgi:microcystin-dependent protein
MDPFIGEVVLFAGNFAPRGWALCEGQLLAINANQALFSILGTTYGGDGRTSFALPDLRGRMATQQGTGPGLPTVSLGEKGGTPTNTLTVNQLPPHNHGVSGDVKLPVSANAVDSDDPAGTYRGSTGSDSYSSSPSTGEYAGALENSLSTLNTGSGQSVNNMPPFLGLNYIIALVGTFPSRN